MKTFVFVPEVTLTNHLDEQVRDDKGGPVVMSHSKWLLERTADPSFGADLKGSEQIELTMEVRRAIRDQADAAGTRGTWELENAHADALWKVTEATRWNPSLVHNMAPFVAALRDRK